MDESGRLQRRHGHADQLVGDQVLLAGAGYECLRLRHKELLPPLQPQPPRNATKLWHNLGTRDLRMPACSL